MNPHYIYLFRQAGIDLDAIQTAVDIGCGAGMFANALDERGIEVSAIDPEDSPLLRPGVHFERTTFENYEPAKVFDLVHARNVVPFMKDKPGQIRRMLKMGTYVFFTFFGPNDPWVKLTASKDEILGALTEAEILYISEEQFVGKTMSGDLKPWHLFTIIAKRN